MEAIKQKNFASAIIYVHNHENTIGNFLKELYNTLNTNFEKFEIICVNDASTDKSTEVIQDLAGSFENCMLNLVTMGFYQGVEASMLAGIDLAIGDFVFEFDEPYMDYEPDLIMQCYNRSLQGFDIVSCGTDRCRTSSKLFYSIYNRYSGTQYHLRSETFRIISRRGINRVHSMSASIPYRKALYYNCGLNVDYIYYESKETKEKRSRKHNLANPQDTALTSLVLFTNIAYKATLAFTITMMLATLISISYVITVYIIGNPVPGYTTMMTLISGAFFALFAILTVVIKYLSVILHFVFHRQKYVLGSIEKITG